MTVVVGSSTREGDVLLPYRILKVNPATEDAMRVVSSCPVVSEVLEAIVPFHSSL